MTRNGWIICCLAYIVGLVSTNLLVFSSLGTNWQSLILLISALTLVGLAVFIIVFAPKFRQTNLKLWLSAVLVAALAVVYFQLRVPKPALDDISYLIEATNRQVNNCRRKSFNRASIDSK